MRNAFSLLEILIVLAIIAILLGFTLGSWQSIIQKQQAKNDVYTLQDTISFARQEAIVKQQIIYLTGINNNWTTYVVTDSFNNILRQVNLAPNAKLTWSDFTTLAAIRFEPYGLIDSQNGTFYYYNNNVLIYTLTMNKAGQVRINKTV